MRVLLAAYRAGKGDVAGNLARHVQLLELARSRGCDLAVFPEFSLTGSVDPAARPEHAMPADAGPVRELVVAAHRIGAGAVFGIAERAADGFAISQLYAYGGRLVGHYRKRRLGEDETAYRTGTEDGVYRLGSAWFGIALCAEGGVDLPWASAAAAGAPVVFHCGAVGLGDAVRHARRYGLWVAMATRAGSIDDEDVPGLAALVTPEGEVAHKLPDRRPGVLVVDIPVEVTVHPVRMAARALVVDERGRTLLVAFVNQRAGTTLWIPPGGGLDAGEDHLVAVRRELREELGRDGFALGPWIGHRTATFEVGPGWLTQQERLVLCRTAGFTPDPGLPALREEGVRDVRWWSADELRSAGVLTAPRHLADLLDGVNAGQLPDPTTDLGV